MTYPWLFRKWTERAARGGVCACRGFFSGIGGELWGPGLPEPVVNPWCMSGRFVYEVKFLPYVNIEFPAMLVNTRL